MSILHRQKELSPSERDIASPTLAVVAVARYHFIIRRKDVLLVDTQELRLETWKRSLKEGVLLELAE